MIASKPNWHAGRVPVLLLLSAGLFCGVSHPSAGAILLSDDFDSVPLGELAPSDLDNWWWGRRAAVTLEGIPNGGGRAIQVNDLPPNGGSPIWGTKYFSPFGSYNQVSVSADMLMAPPALLRRDYFMSRIYLRMMSRNWNRIADNYFFGFITTGTMQARGLGRLEVVRARAIRQPDGTIAREWTGVQSAPIPFPTGFQNYEFRARLLPGGQLQMQGLVDGVVRLDRVFADAEVDDQVQLHLWLRVLTSEGLTSYSQFDNVILSANVVPEPASVSVWAVLIGGIVLGMRRFRRWR